MSLETLRGLVLEALNLVQSGYRSPPTKEPLKLWRKEVTNLFVSIFLSRPN